MAKFYKVVGSFPMQMTIFRVDDEDLKCNTNDRNSRKNFVALKGFKSM